MPDDPVAVLPRAGRPLLLVAWATLTQVRGAGSTNGQDVANPVSTNGGATFQPANIVARHPSYANPLPGGSL